MIATSLSPYTPFASRNPAFRRAVTLYSRALVALSMLFALASQAGSAVLATTCGSSTERASVMLNVTGFKRPTGKINIWVYGSNATDFLARDKRILRLQFPVPSNGPMAACIALPGPGRYAIAAHHDIQSNDKRDMSDGLGFSGNPPLSLLRLKPTYSQTSFMVGQATRQVNVIMLYRSGLSIRPAAR